MKFFKKSGLGNYMLSIFLILVALNIVAYLLDEPGSININFLPVVGEKLKLLLLEHWPDSKFVQLIIEYAQAANFGLQFVVFVLIAVSYRAGIAQNYIFFILSLFIGVILSESWIAMGVAFFDFHCASVFSLNLFHLMKMYLYAFNAVVVYEIFIISKKEGVGEVGGRLGKLGSGILYGIATTAVPVLLGFLLHWLDQIATKHVYSIPFVVDWMKEGKKITMLLVPLYSFVILVITYFTGVHLRLKRCLLYPLFGTVLGILNLYTNAGIAHYGVTQANSFFTSTSCALLAIVLAIGLYEIPLVTAKEMHEVEVAKGE